MNAPALHPENVTYTRMPLCLGLVAQRGLKDFDPEKLRQQIRACLTEFRAQYPDTPFLVLSPLSQEAEQIAAGATLQGVGLPTELIAILGFAHECYRDFLQGESAREEFDRLVGKNRYLELTSLHAHDLPALEANYQAALQTKHQTGPASRDCLFGLAGAFVVRNCQILIAIWDGRTEDGPGGVADLVRGKRTGQLKNCIEPARRLLQGIPQMFGPVDDPLEAPDTGPVYRLDPVRKDQPDPPPAPQPLAPMVYDRDEKPEQYLERLQEIYSTRLNRFNADARRVMASRRRTTRWEQNRSYLKLEQEQTEALPDSLRTLREIFNTADFLANHYQKELVFRSILVGVWLVGVAIAAFGAYAHLVNVHSNYWFLAFYLLCLAVADAIYLVVFRRWNVQNLYQDYRTLAEGLRVQLFWRLAGVPESAADFYLSKQKNELQWIRDAVKAQAVRSASRSLADAKERHFRPDVAIALNSWVVDQLNYYRTSSLRDRARLLRCRQTATGFLMASLLTSFMVALVGFYTHQLLGWAIGFAVVVLSVSIWHLSDKFKEMRTEIDQDLEERRQADELFPNLDPLPEHKKPNFPKIAWTFLALGFFGGLLLTGALWGASFVLGHFWESSSPSEGFLKLHPEEWLIVATALTVGLGVLLQWYAEKMGYEEHHTQYKKMRWVFARAYAQLRQQHSAGETDRVLDTLRHLGREALGEHADWLLLHRQRPLEFPRLEI